MNRSDAPEPAFDALYRDIVLDHYRAPHGRGELRSVSARAEGMNPLCGDEVDLELSVGPDGRIDGVRVEGRGCAISVASGSILHDLVSGADAGGAQRILDAVKAVLHGGPLPADPDLGDFEALEGVKKFPVRVKCALLPWTTLDEALRDLAARRKA
ncbi:MAG: Zinc-dependent sulfurtransferase SufU [Planctomycetes bacterium]|nr:Zinc-dependent sulfurtransferase SufU [Planctomycetota bacterium]